MTEFEKAMRAAEQVTAKALFETLFQACSPLRLFAIPDESPRRITMVTDSVSKGSLYGGVGTAIILGALVSEKLGCRLRILTRSERADSDSVDHLLSTNRIEVTHEVEFAHASPRDDRDESSILPGELFITTSWWTTAATMASVPHQQIIYLLQEDERMFYPFGDERLRCEQVLRNSSIRFILNTKLLRDHLVSEGFSNIAARGVHFEPAFPTDVFYPKDVEKKKKRLIFYARPKNLRNLFHHGLDILEEAIFRGAINLDEWEIVLLGKDIPSIVFGYKHKPLVFQNLRWKEYATLIASADIGFCLMYTPHPSYPPLDLAASGSVVVTNRFGIKQDLSYYSRNILCADLDKESMISALAEAVRLSGDEVRRTENFHSSRLNRDWRTAFSDVISSIIKG